MRMQIIIIMKIIKMRKKVTEIGKLIIINKYCQCIAVFLKRKY